MTQSRPSKRSPVPLIDNRLALVRTQDKNLPLLTWREEKNGIEGSNWTGAGEKKGSEGGGGRCRRASSSSIDEERKLLSVRLFCQFIPLSLSLSHESEAQAMRGEGGPSRRKRTSCSSEREQGKRESKAKSKQFLTFL